MGRRRMNHTKRVSRITILAVLAAAASACGGASEAARAKPLCRGSRYGAFAPASVRALKAYLQRVQHTRRRAGDGVPGPRAAGGVRERGFASARRRQAARTDRAADPERKPGRLT